MTLSWKAIEGNPLQVLSPPIQFAAQCVVTGCLHDEPIELSIQWMQPSKRPKILDWVLHPTASLILLLQSQIQRSTNQISVSSDSWICQAHKNYLQCKFKYVPPIFTHAWAFSHWIDSLIKRKRITILDPWYLCWNYECSCEYFQFAIIINFSFAIEWDYVWIFWLKRMLVKKHTFSKLYHSRCKDMIQMICHMMTKSYSFKTLHCWFHLIVWYLPFSPSAHSGHRVLGILCCLSVCLSIHTSHPFDHSTAYNI